ncbi:MAG: EpsI family protein [Pseudomonadota bacterium]|nr:EpsI family protein [Pseudomonadota bacterium]
MWGIGASPATEGSLEAKLYGQTVERVYQQAATQAEVMMLLAYGDSQTNALQLHRPEVCYPAFGFELSRSQPVQVALGGSVTLPGRALVAEAPGRRENIVYWTRLGAFLPISESEQRIDRLRTSMRGIIADGVLARCSTLGADPAAAFTLLEGFITALIGATAGAARPVLIGAARARAMARAGL